MLWLYNPALMMSAGEHLELLGELTGGETRGDISSHASRAQV